MDGGDRDVLRPVAAVFLLPKRNRSLHATPSAHRPNRSALDEFRSLASGRTFLKMAELEEAMRRQSLGGSLKRQKNVFVLVVLVTSY